MHTVVETHSFRKAAADAGLSEEERQTITNLVAANPNIGELMEGTGGARKFRFPGKGKGKRGGYRIITYYCADDVPVFLLELFSKGERVNLSKAERNELKGILATLADDWRASAKAKVTALGTNRKAQAAS